MNILRSLLLLVFVAGMIASCKSSGTGTPGAQASLPEQKSATGKQPEGQTGTETMQSAKSKVKPDSETVESASVEAGNSCSIILAGGPPPKPNKAADFGSGVARETGRGFQRGIIASIGGAVGGGVGSLIGHAVANSKVRTVQDLNGSWTVTDGSRQCGCKMNISSKTRIIGGMRRKGTMKAQGCSSAMLMAASSWKVSLDKKPFSAKITVYSAAGQELVTMQRQGIDYYSGTTPDGTPIVMWR